MATKYVDPDATGSASGDDWTNAYTTLQAGLTNAGAGGTVYFAASTAVDTGTGTRTITSPGTEVSPVAVIGVKDGTTAEPPADSDIAISPTDTLPLLECTGASGYINFVGAANYYGVRISASNRVQCTTNDSFPHFDGCEIEWGEFLYASAAISGMEFSNCSLEPSAAGADILPRGGGGMTFIGCTMAGTVMTTLVGAVTGFSPLTMIGCDLSNKTSGTLVNASGCESQWRFINCQYNSGASLESGVPEYHGAFVEFINCFSGTKSGASTSSLDYHSVGPTGRVDIDTTNVRNAGGADDGGSGKFSYALTMNANSGLQTTNWSVRTPWFGAIVDGDGSTSKTFTVHIANTGADLFHDDVWMELMTPAADGGADHDYEHSHMISPGETPSVTGGNLADDGGEAWDGLVGEFDQKLEITLSGASAPEYRGMAYCRIHYAARAASPAVLYVDPKLEIT